MENDVKTKVVDFEIDEKTINVMIDAESDVPILIKFSYYPRWEGNMNVYLASPSLIFVFAENNVKLNSLRYQKFV